MAKKQDSDADLTACGNYLGKQRRNFNITNRCWDMMHNLSLDIGVNHSAIIELAVREMYCRYHGEVPPIRYWDGTKAKDKRPMGE